jgi:hypothetical protein
MCRSYAAASFARTSLCSLSPPPPATVLASPPVVVVVCGAIPAYAQRASSAQ